MSFIFHHRMVKSDIRALEYLAYVTIKYLKKSIFKYNTFDQNETMIYISFILHPLYVISSLGFIQKSSHGYQESDL